MKKKVLLFAICLLMAHLGVNAQTKKTIENVTAGQLSTLITNDEKFTITDLTITGELNGTDFRLLRAMAGNDYTGHPTEGKLEKLDLSGVTIVAGGSYAEFEDNMYRYDNNGTMGSAWTSEFQANKLPSCLFIGCSKLQEIKLPSSIEAIETAAFNHTGLTSFIVPKSTEFLGTFFLSLCDNLISLDVESGNTAYWAEDNAIIETSTKRLVAACKNTTIPNTVEIIGQDAFCNTGETIELPQSLIKVENRALYSASLKSINIPASVTEIEGGASASCSNLIEITVDAGSSTYESPKGSNAIIEKVSKTLVAGCQTTVIPSDVTAIGARAFENIYSITSITLPASITSIGRYAFSSCGRLSINLPTSITSIDEYAFANNSNLTVTVESATPLEINENVFNNLSNSTLRVPAGSKSAYAAATGWKNFGTILEGNEGSTFTAKTTEGIDMVFTILDETKKTCQVGYLNGSREKKAVDRETVNGAVTIPEVVEGYTVKKIGKYAFFDIDGIKTISIPETVTSIDDYAFFNCDQISSFELPASVTNIGTCALAIPSLKVAEGNPKYDSRDNCNAIIETATNIIVAGCRATTIPATASEIGSYAFYGLYDCSIFLPSTITKIDDYAFEGNSLNLQVESAEPLEINENVFMNVQNSTLRVPAGCKAAYAAATGWKNFETILEGNEGSTFTAKTTEGWDMVFTILDETKKTCQIGYLDGSWDKIAVDRETVSGSVTIPEKANNYTVVKIGKWALTGINGMTSVTIPNTVTSIDEFAFRYCGLTSFELPANVTYVGRYALSALSNVTSVKVAEGNPNYDSRDNCNAIIETATNILQFGYKISTIPASVKELGIDAFYNLYDYTLTIPSTITKIGDAAFYLNGNLSLQVEHTTPLEINGNVFNRLSNSTLRVPAGCKSAYAAATGWKEFEKIIDTEPAPTGTVIIDGIYYKLNDDYTAEVTKTPDESPKYSGAVTIPATITYGNVEYNVNAIGEYAFYECSELNSISIPNSVTTVEASAFTRCSGLTTLTIPNSVTTIKGGGFFQCSGLTSLTIPKSVTTIGHEAFSYCYGLTSLNVEAGNTKYDSRDNCNAIIETATNKLVSGTKNTVIPNSVTTIGNEAFLGCRGLTSITIPNSVTTIENGAFSYCSGLATITIPQSVTTIGNLVFGDCPNLTSLIVDDANTKYDSRDNCNAVIETSTNAIVAACSTTTIPTTVTEIGSYVFCGLYNCTIHLHSDIDKIGDYAFWNCNGLILDVEKTTPLTINENVFEGLINSTLKVPAGSKSAYAEAIGWKNFGTILEGNEGSTFTAKTTEGWDMVFTILDESAKTCQVGYIDGWYDKRAVSRDAVNGPVTIPETVEGYTVVKIGKYAFNNTVKMTSVTIPETVTSIEEYAFWNCNGLTSFELPANVTYLGKGALVSFRSVTSLKVAEGNTVYDSRGDCNAIIETATNKLLFGSKITTIPADVPEIGEDAFHNLVDYTLTIPSTVTKIDDNAFGWGVHLTLEVEHTTPLDIQETVFNDLSNSTLRVPAGCKAAYAAATGWSLFSNILEENEGSTFTAKTTEGIDMVFTILDESAKTCQVGYIDGWYDKRAVSRDAVNGPVTIPETVEGYTVVKIGKYAFWALDNMTSVTIPQTVTVIDDFAFESCGFTSFELPAGVITIGVRALPSFSKTVSLSVAAGNKKYDSRNGCNAIIETATNKLLFGCINTTIPASVKIIGKGAFNNFTGHRAKDFTLVVPSTITQIEDNAFAYNIMTLQVENEVPLEISENAFVGSKSLSILRVPTGSKAAYASAKGWSQFPHILEGNNGRLFTAETAEGQNMTYAVLDETAKTCQVGRIDGYFIDQAISPNPEGSVTIPEKVNDNTNEYTVVNIGQYAFCDISGMTSVSIPATITSIEEYAFFGSGLTSITIPNRMNSIGDNAFYGCDNLTSVIVEAETPLGISENVFPNRANATLYVPVGSKTAYQAADYWKEFKEIVEAGASSGNIVFASPEVKAACVAKWDTDKDDELSYDEARAVTCLIEDPRNSDDPFMQLSGEDSEFSFDEFQYFTGVTSLTGYEFADCENLTSIILPNSITSIGEGAFSRCKKLTSIHIPASVTYIHTNGDEVDETVSAFISSYLQTITVDPENTKYASPAGSNVIIDTETNKLILGCGNTDFTKVPNTVTTIRRDAFSCVTFANPIVSLPTSVTGIMKNAFGGSNITSINLGELSNLTTIGNEAFSDCKGLTEVTLPASITQKRTEKDEEVEEGIGISVFANCDNIVKVVSNIVEPFNNDNDNHYLDLYYYSFAIYNDAVLYVPEGKVQAYIDKGWKEIDGDVQSFRVITDGDYTPPVAREGLVYGDYDIWMDPNKGQRLIYPGAYRDGMMEYSLDGTNYSTSVPTGKEAGEYTVYYRKVGESDASILKVTIAAQKTISVFSGSNLWAGYVATENLAIPTGLEAYVITNLGATTATASSLNYIPQGVPVLLKRNNASVNDYEISTGTGTAPTVNLLETYDSDKSVSNREGFILYNDEFVLVNEGTLPAGRVFLPANGSGRALTRTIVFDRDDIVDFGDSQENNDDSNQWYDIQGRKLERKPTKKGIYILDGRKVVIK